MTFDDNTKKIFLIYLVLYLVIFSNKNRPVLCDFDYVELLFIQLN